MNIKNACKQKKKWNKPTLRFLPITKTALGDKDGLDGYGLERDDS